MSRRGRLDVTADVLAEGYEPHEIGMQLLLYHELCRHINLSVDFVLSGSNLDRPNADKYGTDPDGTPRYAPEWYIAQSIRTGFHEGLYGVIATVLTCDAEDGEGHRCIGSLLHESRHHDGNGANW